MPLPIWTDPVDFVFEEQPSHDKLNAQIMENLRFGKGGGLICTSTTRPTGAQLFDGLRIYETDTDRFAVYNGTVWRYYATGEVTIAGTRSDSIAGTNDDTATITFGVTFAVAPKVIGTVEVGSNADLVLNWSSPPTTTGVGYRVCTRSGGVITVSYKIHWVAIGPLAL